jgi:glycosyltransferase involved in cell wall biosynthesis
MCVRDGEAYLSEALDSIAAQDVPDLEVILIDNGSNDSTAAIAASHKLKPRVVPQPAATLGAGINRAIGLARGRSLAFIDHDDVWPAGRLRDMQAAMARDPEIDIVHGKVVNTDSQLTPIAEPLAAELFGASLVAREAALRVGELRTDVSHAIVIDWIGRAKRLGLRFKMIDRVVLLRRIHGGNMGIRERTTANVDLLRVIRDHVNSKR